jgi:hypothetical protein
MTTRAALKSSWSLHLPGIVALALMIGLMAYRRPWPTQAPVHFDLHWNSDRFGSPWEAAIFPVLVALILVSEIAASLLWVRHEEGRKKFNLTLPLMATGLGAIAGMHLWYWWNLSELAATGRAPHPWAWLWIAAAIVAITTILLEKLRKPSPAS